MNMPGFNAEESLYEDGGERYNRGEALSSSAIQQSIVPQQSLWLCVSPEGWQCGPWIITGKYVSKLGKWVQLGKKRHCCCSDPKMCYWQRLGTGTEL